jgi:GT2 family glycosyltransferase
VLEKGDAQIIVVDDASTDRTRQVLRGFGRKIKVIHHRENRGFAVSCNAGAKAAEGDFVVFLNNDTLPLPGWLEALERYATDHPHAAVVGSKLVYPDETIQHAGVVICQDRYPRHIYSGFPADHPAVNKSRRFQIVTAASMLVRRAFFEELGGFDSAFRNGFEDVDFCLRAGEQSREIHYCSKSVVRHLESVSAGRFRHDRNNVTLYRERWLRCVQPDDLQYYLEDGLLRFNYEGRYPFILEVSPLLATLGGTGRGVEMERLLQERSRQVAELLRENTRMALEAGSRVDLSSEAEYRQLRQRIQQTVQQVVPSGATIAVISKGDGSLLDFPERQGWHFPQTEHGAYAGHHPADSAEAIAQLEALRRRGAQYILIPAPSLWWLDHYAEFRQHLNKHYPQLECSDDACLVYGLQAEVSREVLSCEM